MQNEHAGDFTISPEAFRDGDVQFRGHNVRKLVKAQSSLMAVDSLRDLSSIPRPERPKHQIRAVTTWKASQPIDSPMFTNPVSHLNVVRVGILRETRSLSLLRGEKTLLAFCNLIEPLGGFFTPILHSTILQLIGGIVYRLDPVKTISYAPIARLSQSV